MCLDNITERLKKPTTLVQDGWKMFSIVGGRMEFTDFAYKGNSRVPMDQWIPAEGKTIPSGSGSYPAGFHVYEDETEAKQVGARHRVYMRGIETRGTQNGTRVVVARELYVPSDPEAWPRPEEIAPAKVHRKKIVGGIAFPTQGHA